ncbi:3-deoxy-D-manno-octulosonic acid transferase [Betaproteobacteria bacterium]|nr:3-deoxy-D-manno-octulosonic acid transferase [Betaproteobacteria bacterium]
MSRFQPLRFQLSLLPYSLLWLLALPLVLARLVWRARRQAGYLDHVSERFGSYQVRAPGPVIWLHAVSVGETRAAEPLVRAMLERWPEHTVVLTHMTPTGREASAALFANESRVLRAYLPYDLGFLATRFLRHFRPDFGIIMETELWPNLLASCHRHQVPVLLANARLSERSARRYARFAALIRPTFGVLSAIGAQTAADAARLGALGARRISITGNIKFDIDPPPEALPLACQFRDRIGARPVILAASTREGEEAALLAAFVRHAEPHTLLALVPRHPQRFTEVEALAHAAGLKVQRRSDNAPLAPDTRVWLGDSMGEMFAYYATADVALIGGSWLPFGGQNPIEACAIGVPVLIGPHTFNFQAVAEDAVNVGAARRYADVNAAMRAAVELLADAPGRNAMNEAGRGFAAVNRGATARTLELLNDMNA